MNEPTEPEPLRQSADEAQACICGSREHAPVRVGDRISGSGGAIIGGIYICPAPKGTGLRDAS